jgi:phosphate transport system protein
MGDHIVRAFDQALDHLASDLARMGGLAEAQVNDAISAITRRDTALAQTVIERDAKVDIAQKEVEKRCTSLLALRQPMANDLREVMAAWKISSDLERVGDLAKNIAKRTLVINQSDPIQLTRSIERMGRLAAAHLKQVLDAYSSREVAPALAVWFQDEDVDAHYNSLFRELLTYMMEDPRTIGPCAHLLFVAKNIERIGDHSTNIAETVHYLVTGEEIATQRPKADDERNA